MGIMIDTRDMAWKETISGKINRITEFHKQNDIDVVWYMDVDSLEERCMDIDSFVENFTACGLFDDLESA